MLGPQKGQWGHDCWEEITVMTVSKNGSPMDECIMNNMIFCWILYDYKTYLYDYKKYIIFTYYRITMHICLR